MKGVKGKLLKKLKSIRPIGYLKPDRILQVSASDGFIESLWSKSNVKVSQQQQQGDDEGPKKINDNIVPVQEPEIIDVSDLMRDLEDEDDVDDKENIRPEIKDKDPIEGKQNVEVLTLSNSQNQNVEALLGDRKHTPLSEIDISSFKPPDLDSGTLFDPNLLAAFEQAVMEVKAQEAERRIRIEEQKCYKIKEEEEEGEEEEEPPFKARKIEENSNPLLHFEEKCPPGGDDSVILYTTGLRGIRKTFEDCTSIRFLLESFRVLYHERDVSMHSDFREELWRTLGGKIVPPRLFIKGRYIGGAEEVLGLHEQGKLTPLFDGVPIDQSNGPCLGCAGFRFVLCFSCNGSRKIVNNEDDVSVESIICQDCNENGLIICPICC
ncbi:hypothetical protein LguiB_035652 [Lonicera macranthoides]